MGHSCGERAEDQHVPNKMEQVSGVYGEKRV